MEENVVIREMSQTQRLTATVTDESVLVSKDWRTSGGTAWHRGKGISLNDNDIYDLYDISNSDDIDATLDEFEWAGDYDVKSGTYTTYD